MEQLGAVPGLVEACEQNVPGAHREQPTHYVVCCMARLEYLLRCLKCIFLLKIFLACDRLIGMALPFKLESVCT